MADQRGERIRADEGRVAVQHHDLAFETVQQRQGLRDGMARPELLFLQRDLRLGVQLRDSLPHRIGAMSRDDDHPLWIKAAARGQRMAHQRHAPQPVQHLGQVRQHPAALPRRQHHQRHRLIRHPPVPPVH